MTKKSCRELWSQGNAEPAAYFIYILKYTFLLVVRCENFTLNLWITDTEPIITLTTCDNNKHQIEILNIYETVPVMEKKIVMTSMSRILVDVKQC